ncbi:MAG: GNAT family N-acetyltransferase [Pacificimonas sp.]
MTTIYDGGFMRIRPSQAKRAADLTAEAFREDPFNMWLFDGKFGAMRDVFRLMFRYQMVPHGLTVVDEDWGGAAAWTMPDDENVSPPDWRFLWALIKNGALAGLPRMAPLTDMMAKGHPDMPHIYLFTIGTLPRVRGSGLGRRLMAPMLAHADAHRLPVYLENSNPANGGFYRSHGFERTEMMYVEDGAPPLEGMLRSTALGAR